MSYPHPSFSKVMDDESHYQEFDDPLASDGSDFEEIASVEADDIFSDDDSCFSLTSIEISELKDMRRGWNNRASALGTDETIIIDAENDLNLQENEELLNNMWNRYSNRNKGRRKFQIALALELMIYAIELDWKDKYNENEKPRWMRQSSYIPCGCKRCFFCINGKTSGVHHDKSTIVMTSPGSGKKRKRGVRCTYHRFTLARLKGRGAYCRQCYRKMKGKNKKSKCKYSYMGCPACDEPICGDCWKNGYDNVLHKP